MVWSMPVDPQHNLAVALRRAEPAAASHILRTAQLRRREYLAALEKTSVQGEISDFLLAALRSNLTGAIGGAAVQGRGEALPHEDKKRRY